MTDLEGLMNLLYEFPQIIAIPLDCEEKWNEVEPHISPFFKEAARENFQDQCMRAEFYDIMGGKKKSPAPVSGAPEADFFGSIKDFAMSFGKSLWEAGREISPLIQGGIFLFEHFSSGTPAPKK